MKTTGKFRAMLSLITVGLLAGSVGAQDSDGYAESFESYDVGLAITNVAGWEATDEASVIASTNYTADYMGGDYPIDYDHAVNTKVLLVENGVTNTITPGDPSVTNWVDVVIKPVLYGDGETPDLPPVGSVAAVYFNSSSNLVVMHTPINDSSTNAWLEIPDVMVSPDNWIRLTIAANMVGGDFFGGDNTRFYQVYINGTVVSNDAAYPAPTRSGSGGTWFGSGADIVRTDPITNIVVKGTGYIDDLVVTNALTVTPAQPAVPSYIASVAVSNVLSYGQTVAEAGVYGTATNALGANVPGQFAFDDPAAVPPVGTNSFAVTFTPDAPHDYLTATGLVDVVVVASTTTNGTPISWYDDFGLTPGDVGLTTYEELDAYDSDADGAPNAEEYLAGTNPEDINSVFKLVGLNVSTTNLTLRWIGGTNGPVTPYIVEGATSLVGTTIGWMNITNSTRVEGTNTWNGTSGGTMLFFRVLATP